MIEVTSPSGTVTYLAASAIASITEAGASSQWYGIKSYVKTFDGKTLECRESASEVADMVNKRTP